MCILDSPLRDAPCQLTDALCDQVLHLVVYGTSLKKIVEAALIQGSFAERVKILFWV